MRQQHSPLWKTVRLLARSAWPLLALAGLEILWANLDDTLSLDRILSLSGQTWTTVISVTIAVALFVGTYRVVRQSMPTAGIDYATLRRILGRKLLEGQEVLRGESDPETWESKLNVERLLVSVERTATFIPGAYSYLASCIPVISRITGLSVI